MTPAWEEGGARGILLLLLYIFFNPHLLCKRSHILFYWSKQENKKEKKYLKNIYTTGITYFPHLSTVKPQKFTVYTQKGKTFELKK